MSKKNLPPEPASKVVPSNSLEAGSDEPSPLRRSESSNNLFANLSLDNMDCGINHNGSNLNLTSLVTEEDDDDSASLTSSDFPTTPPLPNENFHTPKKPGMHVRVVHFDESVKVRALSFSDDENKDIVAEATGFLKSEPMSLTPVYAQKLLHINTPAVQAALDALDLKFSYRNQPPSPSPLAENIIGPEKVCDSSAEVWTNELQAHGPMGDADDELSLHIFHANEPPIAPYSPKTLASMLLAEFLATTYPQDNVVVAGGCDASSPIVLGEKG